MHKLILNGMLIEIHLSYRDAVMLANESHIKTVGCSDLHWGTNKGHCYNCKYTVVLEREWK